MWKLLSVLVGLVILLTLGWVGAPLLSQPYPPSVPFNAPTVVASVSITTGGTFQTVLAAVPNPSTNPNGRHSVTIQNNNTTATENCWLFVGVGGTVNTAR